MAITPENPNSIPKPTAISGEADAGIDTPTVVTPEADSGISTPVTVTPEADSGISAPNAVTPKADSGISTPASVSSQAVINPVAPNVLAPLTPAGINRALSPLFNFNAALGLPESVTYSRSSSASYTEEYVGPLSRKQKRLTNDYVGSVTNLALYSEDLDNAVWSTVGLSKSRRNGEQGDEFLLTEDTGTGEHRLDQSGVVSTTDTNTYTVRAKSYKNRGIFLKQGNSFGAYFDLSNGIITLASAGVEASIRYADNGFYDCSITFASPANDIIRLNLVITGTTTLNYQGDGESGVIIKRAQATISAKPLPYVRTFDSAVTKTFTANPRYEEKGLLVEGASTNLALGSDSLTGTGWSENNTTITSGVSLSVDGSFTGNRLVTANGITLASASRTFSITKAAISNTYTYSVYAKAEAFDRVTLLCQGSLISDRCQAVFDLSSGLVISELNVGGFTSARGESEYITNGWHRVSLTFTTNTDTSLLSRIYCNDSVAAIGDASSGISIWGAQLEALPFATSYIRTEGATVSRALEGITGSVAPSNIGTLLIESAYFGSTASLPSNRVSFVLTDGGTTDIYFYNGASSQDALAYILDGDVVQVFNTNSIRTDQELRTSVFTFEGGEQVYYQENILTETGSSGRLPQNATILNIGALGTAAFFFGHIKRLEVYDLALTANEVKAL